MVEITYVVKGLRLCSGFAKEPAPGANCSWPHVATALTEARMRSSFLYLRSHCHRVMMASVKRPSNHAWDGPEQKCQKCQRAKVYGHPFIFAGDCSIKAKDSPGTNMLPAPMLVSFSLQTTENTQCSVNIV